MSKWIKKLAEAYSEVNENQSAAVKKALAKASAPSEKGKKAVTLPKAPFEIPEDIPATERTAFHGAAAGAHKAGKSHFTFQSKKYPVTMKKDTATAIADQKEAAGQEVDEASAYYTQSVAQHLAKKDGHDYHKLPVYALGKPHQQGYHKKAQDALASGKYKSGLHDSVDLNKSNADAAIKHDCATHVEHAKWGEGQPISEMHTIVETAPGVGYVTHYDVMFEHGIEKNVAVEDLNILAEMSHGHSKKKSKNEMSSKEKMKRGLYNGSKDDEVVMNPKKEKKEKDAASEAGMQEAVIYKRIIEARKMKATADKGGEHSKGATDQEEMGDKQASSKGAQDMMNTPKQVIDNPEASGDEVNKAASAGPKASTRKGDNQAGDKKIIPSATPMKGM